MAASVVNLLKRTASLAGATLASRVLGFLREILMADVLGGSAVASAWNFAVKIPNLFRRVFGEGLLGTVLVPLISQSVERSGRENARRQFSTIFMWQRRDTHHQLHYLFLGRKLAHPSGVQKVFRAAA